MRHALALCIAATASFSPVALALDVPAFVAGQQVYLVPDDYRFPTQKLRAAVGEVEHPVYVVVYEEVIDGSIAGDFDSETEEAIEAVWGEWRTAAGMAEAPVEGGLDASEGSLVLLAMDDREVRIMAGSRWDSELGLQGDALLPIIDQHFMPLAVAQDYDAALAALAIGLDERISTTLAQRAARARQEAERAERERVEALEAATRSEARKQALGRWLRWGGAALGLGLVLALVAFFRLAAIGTRNRFREAAARLRAQLDAADASFADFRIDVELRDRIVDLRLKGPVTTALYGEVSRSLDEIQAGLAGLRGHVDDCEQVQAGTFASTPWKQALDRLEGSLVIRTAQTRDRLFPAPDQDLEVQPSLFMESLEERFAGAKQGWQRLLDAVEASLHKASADLPRTDLEAMLVKLDAAGLPRVWVHEHPLLEDPEACWDALDTLRREDPAAYLDELESEVAVDDELEALVDEIIAGLAHAHELRGQADEPSVAELATLIDDPERDPAPVKEQADSLLKRLRAIAGGEIEPDEAAFREALVGLEQACETWVARKRRLIATVQAAPGLVAQAEEKLSSLERSLRAGRERAGALAQDHDASSLAAAWVEVGQAGEDLEQCRAATRQAREWLGQHRHVTAEASAQRALLEHGEAVRDLTELIAVLEALDKAKRDAELVFTSLGARRDVSLGDMSGLGRFGGTEHLVDGDRLRDALVADWAAGVPVDWVERRERSRAVLSAWQHGVSRARSAWRDEQARLEAIRLAEERRRREEARRRREAERARQRERDRQRRRSSRSSSSSRSSFGSMGSSSRKRSGGGSFGSSRRSGGRKTRSRRRSGGRKF
jgi:uncharacterized membrane protein YgcG